MLEQGSNIVDKIYVGANRSQYLYSGSTLTFTDYFYTLEKRVLADGGSHITNSLGNSSLYPVPSLSMFPVATKESKLYSVLPTDGTGDFTVVRATTATRVNAQGLIETVAANVPRINYENGVGSLLVEPQATNLLLRSEEFDNISWSKIGSTVILNSLISPDGVQSADTFVGGVVFGNRFLAQIASVISGTSYTTSIYAKKNTNNFIQIIGSVVIYTSGTVYANFDLDNGVVSSVGAGTTATIINVGNGWYRCTMTATATATVLGSAFVVSLIISATSPRAEGNNLDTSVYLWGAQLETGTVATSYIPTVASTVTRNSDSISKTGISSLIGQTGGTLFLDFELLPNNINGSYLFSLSDGSSLNLIRSEIFILNPTVSQFRTGLNTAGVGQGDNFTTITQLRNKMAISYSLNNFKLFINGALVYTDATADIPATSGFYLGNRLGVGNIIGANYKLASIFKTQLTDAECITLTTL